MRRVQPSPPDRGRGPVSRGARPTVLRRLTVAGRPGLLIRAAPHPGGGIHGGHLGVVFDAGADGYLVTGHLLTASPDGPTPATPAVVDALIAVATSMARARPG